MSLRAKFDRIYNSTKDSLYSYALRVLRNEEDALDTLQETYRRLWIHIEKIEEDRALSWLMRVCHNLMMDHFRKKREHVDIDALDEILPSSSGVKTMYIEDMLTALPENYREALLLRFNYSYSYKEIADILGINENTAKTWVRRGLIVLRKMWKT